MNPHYKQLTQVERYQIEALQGLGESARSISNTLKRSNKTISRELLRLKGQSYQAEVAERHARIKRCNAKKFSTCTASNQDVINQQLSLGLSPEQIAGRMRLEGIQQAPSCSSVYRWVSRLGWRSRLPRKGKPRRRPNEGGAGLKHIPNRIDIDQRPAIVDTNTEMGHWEGDTIHGQDSYVVTLVERFTKTLLVAKVPDKSKKSVGRAVIRLLKRVGSLCKTITFDNGGGFADHQLIAKKLKCKIFFAKPYHSWQRGLNENTNGLIRRFFPKKTCFANISDKQIDDMQFLINNRPRKALQFRTPLEVLAGRSVSLIVNI